MAVGNFNNNKSQTKSTTNREGDGIHAGSNPTSLAAPRFDTYEVNVKRGGKASDVTQVFSGPRTGVAMSVGSAEDDKGFVTSTGSKVAIHGTPGAESIELVHHSGATIMIDVDGSIFLMPTSRKGFGLNASHGDGVISAHGRLVLKGMSDITIETEGSMSFNVGQNMFMNIGGDMVVDVGRSYSESIDGAKTTEVVKDVSYTIGGALRETVAADKRTQVVGEIRQDAGKNIENRSDMDIINDAQKGIKSRAKEQHMITSTEDVVTVGSMDDVHIISKSNIRLISSENITLDSDSNIVAKATGNQIYSAKGKTYLDSTDDVVVRTDGKFKAEAGTELDLASALVKFDSTGQMFITSSAAMDLVGSTVDINTSSRSGTAPTAAEPTDVRDRETPDAPQAPEYPDAKTIQSNMSSIVDAPSFPKNAKKMSANEMSIYENEGDKPPPKAKQEAEKNPPGGNPYSKGESAGTIPDSGNLSYDGNSNDTKSQQSQYPTPPSVHNGSEKLSKNMTVGQFPGLGSLPSSQMGYSQKEIMENVKHLCMNIIDPLLDKFGSQIHLSHGIRLGSGGSRHYVGKAIDLRSASNDHTQTAMIAKWIVENLPFDRVFLEANRSGTIHIHAEAAPPGTKGARTVWTCAEPTCNSRTDGLVLSYAEQGLKRMGFA